jgi:hypothetical protein
MQRIDIDRCDLGTIGHRSVSKTLYAARLAEQMCDSFFVESILGKVVFAFQELELRARRECQNGTEGLTSRTIARYAPVDIHFDFISHGTALAPTLIMFFHLYPL